MSVPEHIMLVAGEASGDQYGARLIAALKGHFPSTRFTGIGGDRMRSEGMELLYHIRDTSVMGFVEVAKKYPFFRRMLRRCIAHLESDRPGVLIPIDYPGFNFRLARGAKTRGIPVVYYISPQVWAWGKRRVNDMRSLVDHVAVVFPFEEELFESANIPVTFVGHPLLEILPTTDRNVFLDRHHLPEGRILALFPGSRKQEIQRMLPVMLDAAVRIRTQTNCTIAIGAASLPSELFTKFIGNGERIFLLHNDTHALMQHAHAALVTSGTATVETAFYQTPMVILYRSSFLNYQIGKRLINVRHIGMPNILVDDAIVPELIQNDVTVEAILRWTMPYFEDESAHLHAREKLARVRESMGTPGASERVAEIVLRRLSRSVEAVPE